VEAGPPGAGAAETVAETGGRARREGGEQRPVPPGAGGEEE
jgi:hypothetical protein